MKIGTKIRLTKEAASFFNVKNRNAVVVGTSRTPDCTRIVLEGRKTPQTWHKDYIRRA